MVGRSGSALGAIAVMAGVAIEGNEAVPDMLRGHRMEERDATAKSPTNR